MDYELIVSGIIGACVLLNKFEKEEGTDVIDELLFITHPIERLLNSHTLREVPRLVDICPPRIGHMIRK